MGRARRPSSEPAKRGFGLKLIEKETPITWAVRLT